MKILILDAFEKEDNSYGQVSKILTDKLNNKNIEYEVVALHEKNIKYCRGCFACLVVKPGKCIIKDDIDGITEKVINSDITVFYSPVIFGGYSSRMKLVLDRLAALISPMFFKHVEGYHHKKRYSKYPNLLGLGIISDEIPEEIENFKQLVFRNSINYHANKWHAEVFTNNDTASDIEAKILKAFKNVEV